MTRTDRRSLCALAVIAVLAFHGRPAFAQGPSTGTTVYPLEAGEEILRAESTIELSADATDVILVLAKGKGKTRLISCSATERRPGPMPGSRMP